MATEKKVNDLINEMRKSGSLPALDQNVHALCALAEKTETQTADLTAIIMRDAALTSQVLSVANSAAYRTRTAIKTVSSAVILLGMDKVQSLALGLSIFRKSKENAKSRELYCLFTCAYFTGSVAMSLAHQAGYACPEEVFVGGILHQLPRLLLANAFPEKYAELERGLIKDRLPINRACELAFGVNYTDITRAVADYWSLPETIRRTISDIGSVEVGPAALIHLAGQIADMIFGNAPAGTEPMSQAEQGMRRILKVSDFSLSRFLQLAAESDETLTRFFGLNPKDIEMMVKIAEWGKVNSAEVAASLATGFEFKDQPQPVEDPRLLIGHFLSDLMLAVQRRVGLNDILMIAQEAIYRCLNPACVFTAFYDKPRQVLLGRLYAGHSALVSAADYKLTMTDRECLAVKCMDSTETIQVNVRAQRVLPFTELILKLHLEYALIAPIPVMGKPIGQYFVGQIVDKSFMTEDRHWLEAIAGHVGLAFEKEKQAAPTSAPSPHAL